MDVRKNQSALSASDRRAFVSAVLQLKNAVPSQLGLSNRYDDYVQIHMESMMVAPGWAHRGPAFFPWHRALLRNFEQDLKAIDPAVSLPYWDWTVDQSQSATPWTADFLGGDGAGPGGKVMSGPFAFDAGHWTINIREPSDTIPFLVRAFGQTAANLPTPANLTGALGETPYDAAPWGQGDQPSYRDRLEGWHGEGSIHNRVHLWVGGSMLPSTSPNDPVFFMHHCNVDRMWAVWQRQHPVETYRPTVADPGAPIGHRLTDPMQPWGGAVTVASMMDHHSLGYMYDTDPTPVAGLIPFSVGLGAGVLPPWTYKLSGMSMNMGVMFGLSPEDIAAGGHDMGSG